MAIEVACERCGRKLSVRDELAGRIERCSGCGAKVMVPSQTGSRAAAPAVPPSSGPAGPSPGADPFAPPADVVVDDEEVPASGGGDPAIARAMDALRSFPPHDGSRADFPLGSRHLEILVETERERRKVRVAANWYRIQGIIQAIFAALYLVVGLAALGGTVRGGGVAFLGILILIAIMGGLATLSLISHRLTLRCRIWPPIVWIVLYGIGTLVVVVGGLAGMGQTRSGPEQFGQAFALVIALVINGLLIVVSVQAVGGARNFLRQPLWAVKALVRSKL